jgi:HEAT repeat protein
MKNEDNDIIDALTKTLNTDPNTNVRLAALDALSEFYRESYVKKKLISALKKQTDPMVQISLIKLLTQMREHSILKELDKMVKDGSTPEAVKDHAYESIFLLRS